VQRSKKADRDPAGAGFRRGVELFNQGEFWHAHEAWEAEWLTTTGDRAQFLQGLIQLAAACYHVQKGNDRGAAKLRKISLQRLGSLPDGYGGVALGELCAQASLGTWEGVEDIQALRVRYVEPS